MLTDIQTDKPTLTYDQWKQELIDITARETGADPLSVKLNDHGAREWYQDGFTPYATFRENFRPCAPYIE